MGLGHPSRQRRGGRRTTGQRAVGALLAAVSFAPLPLAAQATDSTDARAQVLDPVTAGAEADMDFGQITTAGNSGTVVIPPSGSASPTCTTTGGLLHDGNCRPATFTGDVSFLYVLRVTRPAGNQMTLTGPGGATMTVNNFTFGTGGGMLGWGSTATEQRYLILNVAGNFTLHVGGTLHVAANQAPGVYTGTFALTFNYD